MSTFPPDSDRPSRISVEVLPGVRPRRPLVTKGQKRTAGVVAALFASCVAIFLAARFERKPPPPQAKSGTVAVSGSAVAIANGAPQWDVIRLGKAEATVEQWTDPVPAYVRVDETRASRVGSPLGGRVVRVFAELGQVVTPGTPLFSVASPDLAALRADQERARVDLAGARTTYERVQAIVQARALPEKEAIAAAQTVKQAELALTATTSRLNSLKVMTQGYGEFVVQSPRAGQVAEKSVLPGQEIDAGALGNLMMVADLSRVWVVAELFESDTAGVKPGTKTRVTVASAPGRVFEAQVDTVSAVVDPDRHSVPIRVQIDNPDGSLRPNTFARMQFLTLPSPGSVEIAASSLVTDGSAQYVYVRTQDGKFSRRKVTAGAAREGRVTVADGLVPGDIVVEKGAILLDNQIAISE